MNLTEKRIWVSAVAVFLLVPLFTFQNCSEQAFTKIDNGLSSTGTAIRGRLEILSSKVFMGEKVTNSTNIPLRLVQENAVSMAVLEKACDDRTPNDGSDVALNGPENLIDLELSGADSKKTISAVLKDLEGNSFCTEDSVRLDQKLPIFSIVYDDLSPLVINSQNFTAKKNAKFTISVDPTTDDIQSFECQLNSGQGMKNCSTELVFPTDFAEGSNQVQVVATDFAGNASIQTLNFVADLSDPEAKVDLVTVTGQNVTVNVSATDAGSGIELIQCRVDNVSANTVVQEWTTCGGTSALAALADATYKFSVRAFDKVARQSLVADKTFTIDTRTPEAFMALGLADGSVDTVIDGYLVGPGAPIIYWTPSAGAMSYDGSIYPVNADSAPAVAISSCGFSAYTPSATSNVLAAGTTRSAYSIVKTGCSLEDGKKYVLKLIARKTVNGLALTTSAPDFEFVVDRLGLDIQIVDLKADSPSKKVDILIQITDRMIPAKTVGCYLTKSNDASLGGMITSPASCALPSIVNVSYLDLAIGKYEFFAKATDILNREAITQKRSFEIAPVVCNPFGTPTQQEKCKGGIKGSLHYLTSSQKRYDLAGAEYFNGREASNAEIASIYSSVDSIISGGAISGGSFNARVRQPAVKANAEFYLPFIDVRARSFTRGFGLENTTTTIKDAAGNTITEWFALNLQTILKLGPSDEEGYYHLIVVSDDGTLVRVKDDNQSAYRTLINHDGAHPPAVGCPVNGEALYLTKESRIPLEIKYYQGPRDHIAFSMFWRKVAKSESANNVLNITKSDSTVDALRCGAHRTQDFFTTTVGYSDLLNNGYAVPNESNFIIDESK